MTLHPVPERYARFDRLSFDMPAERVLRVTFDRPETCNEAGRSSHGVRLLSGF